MSVSLLAISVTYRVLSPQDFALFNIVAFFIALSSAVSQPINRVFWAEGSDVNYPFSSIASLSLTAGIVATGMAAAAIIGAYSPLTSIACAAASALYGGARVIERYAYGRLLVAGYAKASVLPILLFASIDMTAAGAMWMSGSHNVILRILTPAMTFFAIVILIDRSRAMPRWISPPPSIASLKKFLSDHLFSAMGGKILFTGAVLTLAGMVDRAIFYFSPPASDEFGAAYLLALAYAIALQTLLSLLFDLARAYVYRDRHWQTGARRFTGYVVLAAVGVIVISVVSYPVLVLLGLLSGQVHWLLWLAMLVRGLALALSMILNVDHFQEGRTGPIVKAAVMVLIGTLLSQMVLQITGSQPLTAALMLTVSGGVIAVIARQFFKRVPGT